MKKRYIILGLIFVAILKINTMKSFSINIPQNIKYNDYIQFGEFYKLLNISMLGFENSNQETQLIEKEFDLSEKMQDRTYSKTSNNLKQNLNNYNTSYTNHHVNIRYEFLGTTYLEHAQIRTCIIYPDSTKKGNDFTAILSIPYAYTKNENTGEINYGETNIKVKNMDIQVSTEKSDCVHQLWWSKSTGTKFDSLIDLYTYSHRPKDFWDWVGFEVDYTFSGKRDSLLSTFNSEQTHVKAQMDKKQYLNAMGHFFSIGIKVRRTFVDGFDGNKDFRAKFSYDIDHPMKSFSRTNYQLIGTYYSEN